MLTKLKELQKWVSLVPAEKPERVNKLLESLTKPRPQSKE